MTALEKPAGRRKVSETCLTPAVEPVVATAAPDQVVANLAVQLVIARRTRLCAYRCGAATPAGFPLRKGGAAETGAVPCPSVASRITGSPGPSASSNASRPTSVETLKSPELRARGREVGQPGCRALRFWRHAPSLRRRCWTAACISTAFQAVQSLLCRIPGSSVLRPAARQGLLVNELPSVALTQRFLALCEFHGSHRLAIRLVAMARSTGVPGLPPGDDWTAWDAHQMRAAVDFLEQTRVR